MDITHERVEYIAQLAMLELTEPEKEMYARQLTDILTHVSLMSELDTSNILPTSHPIPMENIFREDVPFIYRDAASSNINALSNAPQQRDGYFIVPSVME
ncbi:MAG: Asp-tRNA(Asn)/Glu-tRNA(Gln) amidotransferase subunit GatC [bacterium]